MSIKVEICPLLRRFTGDRATVQVNGSTVGQCLDDLVMQFPQVKPWLFLNEDKLHNEVDIYINRQSSHPEGLAKPVRDGDELHIAVMIAGG